MTERGARISAVDIVRGVAMVLMALDHTRGFFSRDSFLVDPTDLDGGTTPALFLTRWLSHFCAPIFVFLAGAGAFLHVSRGDDKWKSTRFLATRGLLLVLLDLTVVDASWSFRLDWTTGVRGTVLWPIGGALVVLAVMIWLPRAAVGAIGVAIIALHNLVASKTAEQVHLPASLWAVLESGDPAWVLPGVRFTSSYTLLGWVGVACVGYAFGAMLGGADRRRVVALGAAVIALFVVVRLINAYGDMRYPAPPDAPGLSVAGEPGPWTTLTFLAFINCQKYPPSLVYILMTLGPTILAVGLLDRELKNRAARVLELFGQVPLFFFLLHIPLIHALAIVADYARYGTSPFLHAGPWAGPLFAIPDSPLADYGFGLPATYVAWMLVLALLYPACRWFRAQKRARKGGWASYL